MARYISEHPELVTNRTVLELGAGLGLPSIVSTYQNAKLVHATDRASAVSLLEENVRWNANNDCDIKIFAFDWNIDKLSQKYQVFIFCKTKNKENLENDSFGNSFTLCPSNHLMLVILIRRDVYCTSGT